jgi:hypothetical protein
VTFRPELLRSQVSNSLVKQLLQGRNENLLGVGRCKCKNGAKLKLNEDQNPGQHSISRDGFGLCFTGKP